jgi:hypothetical protein
MNYKRSEYFEEIIPVLEKCIEYNTRSLSELNKSSIIYISNFLNIKTHIIANPSFSQLEYNLSLEKSNMHNKFPNIKVENLDVKSIRAIAICKKLDANIYINPIGGVNLYSPKDFTRNGINIHFLKMKEIKYQQNSRHFYSHLSIIDVLMNCGKNNTIKLLNQYDLIS